MNLTRYNAIDIDDALREETPAPAFPPAADRDSWAKIRAGAGEDEVAEIIAAAEDAAASEIPALTATHYLVFKREGERASFESLIQRRRFMLAQLALAECLEYKGRFLDPLLNIAWATCEESSWSYPAHQSELADMEHQVIDLFASMTGTQLAELLMLLEPELDPRLGQRIRYEMNNRIFTPYLTRHDHHWLYNTQHRTVNNWTAVCNGNVVNAAIRLETDLSRLAEMIARAARSLDDYLETFDPDGGSTEGPGYWAYGFGNYVLLAQAVEWRTNGRIRFMDGDHIRNIAQFPLRTMMSPGFYTNFSDCDPIITYPPALLVYLAQRLDLPGLVQLVNPPGGHRGVRSGELNWALRNLVWRVPTETARTPFIPPRQDWYGGMMWMIARYDPHDPDALVLAAKGGHNGEMHNQNDVGSYIVHLNRESVIADIGRGRYTKAYFDHRRYDHFVNQSLGHSCPVPNGHMQMPQSNPRRGAGNRVIDDPDRVPPSSYASELLEHRSDDQIDLMQIELRKVYPAEADLQSLRRTVALHRQAPRGWVEVVDEVDFASAPGTLESVVTTFGAVEIADGVATLRGEKGTLAVHYDPAHVQARVELVKDVDLAMGARDVNRVVFALRQPAQSGVIRLEIRPV
jgi:hypothetical protein